MSFEGFSGYLKPSCYFSFCSHDISLDLLYRPSNSNKRSQLGCVGGASLTWGFPTSVLTPWAESPAQPGQVMENLTAFSAAASNERRAPDPWARRPHISPRGTMRMEPDGPFLTFSLFFWHRVWSGSEACRLSSRIYQDFLCG